MGNESMIKEILKGLGQLDEKDAGLVLSLISMLIELEKTPAKRDHFRTVIKAIISLCAVPPEAEAAG